MHFAGQQGEKAGSALFRQKAGQKLLHLGAQQGEQILASVRKFRDAPAQIFLSGGNGFRRAPRHGFHSGLVQAPLAAEVKGYERHVAFRRQSHGAGADPLISPFGEKTQSLGQQTGARGLPSGCAQIGVRSGRNGGLCHKHS